MSEDALTMIIINLCLSPVDRRTGDRANPGADIVTVDDMINEDHASANLGYAAKAIKRVTEGG